MPSSDELKKLLDKILDVENISIKLDRNFTAGEIITEEIEEPQADIDLF